MDWEYGFELAGARYYDNTWGRFMTRDPAGYAGGMNLYEYVGNNPLTRSDPSGLFDILSPNSCNYFAGWGDTLVPFGLTEKARCLLGACNAVDRCSSAYKAGQITGEIHNFAFMLATAGAAAPAAAAEGSGEALEAGDEVVELAEDGCFIAGTPVSVAGGKTEPIEAVKKNERLESRDPSNLKSEAEPIQQSTVRTVHRVVSLTLADNQGQTETITATGEHPFWVEGQGFVPAGALRTGEHLTSRDGELITVRSATWHFSKSGYTVYNFIVPQTHTYFVGRLGGGVWVHNGVCPYQVGRYNELEEASARIDIIAAERRAERSSGTTNWKKPVRAVTVSIFTMRRKTHWRENWIFPVTVTGTRRQWYFERRSTERSQPCRGS